MANIESVVDNLIRGPVEALGYELVDVSFKKEGTIFVLTIYIDKEGGVNMDDCVRVNDLIDPIIDEADPVPMSYSLSVSSPGLDRPIKTERDFIRNLGKDIVVKLYKAREKRKEYVGSLQSFSETTLVIDAKGVQIEFDRRDIAHIKPYITF